MSEWGIISTTCAAMPHGVPRAHPAGNRSTRFPLSVDSATARPLRIDQRRDHAIPDLLDHLAEVGHLKGALVTIDAMGTQVEIAARIVSHGADYLLPLKGNQPTLEADVEAYFRTAPASELITKTTVEKGHGRIETRVCAVSGFVDWIASDRSYPGQPRFTGISSIVKVYCRTEHPDRSTFETRHYICSAKPDIERVARGARGHWGVESMHWLLDVEFKDDLSRYRTGNGAKNMAVSDASPSTSSASTPKKAVSKPNEISRMEPRLHARNPRP